MATAIADGVLVTNFGPRPGANKVTVIAKGDVQAAIGPVVPLALTHDAQVAASQTDQVVYSFMATGKFEILSISYWARAVAGTVSFDLYNATDTAAIIANLTPTTTAQSSTTFVSEALQVVDDGDIVSLRATTAGASTIDGLVVVLNIRYISEAPDGV